MKTLRFAGVATHTPGDLRWRGRRMARLGTHRRRLGCSFVRHAFGSLRLCGHRDAVSPLACRASRHSHLTHKTYHCLSFLLHDSSGSGSTIVLCTAYYAAYLLIGRGRTPVQPILPIKLSETTVFAARRAVPVPRSRCDEQRRDSRGAASCAGRRHAGRTSPCSWHCRVVKPGQSVARGAARAQAQLQARSSKVPARARRQLQLQPASTSLTEQHPRPCACQHRRFPQLAGAELKGSTCAT